jgi:hypothetical protein
MFIHIKNSKFDYWQTRYTKHVGCTNNKLLLAENNEGVIYGQ